MRGPDAGQYTCVAINPAGQAASTATLRVNTDHWQGKNHARDYFKGRGVNLVYLRTNVFTVLALSPFLHF